MHYHIAHYLVIPCVTFVYDKELFRAKMIYPSSSYTIWCSIHRMLNGFGIYRETYFKWVLEKLHQSNTLFSVVFKHCQGHRSVQPLHLPAGRASWLCNGELLWWWISIATPANCLILPSRPTRHINKWGPVLGNDLIYTSNQKGAINTTHNLFHTHF